MKFRVERDVLADAAAWVARSLPARPSVPVLGGVLVEAASGGDGDHLTMSGFDYETSARVQLDATIGDPGRVLVSGRLLADITRALPSKPVDLVVDGARATIKDRKSTRLNSSHGYISYAVFCLKKKKPHE